jgi:hypothetical protein
VLRLGSSASESIGHGVLTPPSGGSRVNTLLGRGGGGGGASQIRRRQLRACTRGCVKGSIGEAGSHMDDIVDELLPQRGANSGQRWRRRQQ